MSMGVTFAETAKLVRDRFRVIATPILESNERDTCLWHAPYNEDSALSCYLFVTECCWTYNEADGPFELIPDKEYIRLLVFEWWAARAEGRTLIVEKSRRLIASWIFRACQLWALGLKRGKHIIVGLTYGKAAEHVWRIWHLWEQICVSLRWFGDDPKKLWGANHWGGDPEAQSLDVVLLPNGSLISKINQEKDTFQGSGYSQVDLEEFSLYHRPASILSQARFVTQGKPGEVGGFIVVITNAAPNLEWHDCKLDAYADPDAAGKVPHIQPRRLLGFDDFETKNLLMQGMAATYTRADARYIALHYSADPDKTPEWAAAEKLKASGEFGTREWNQQMELKEDIYQGEPVFQDYADSRHCPKSIHETGIKIVPGSLYIGGWDIGLQPAFTLVQVTPKYQIQVILEVTSDGGDPMETFAPRVLWALQKRLPGEWNTVYHGGDQTILNRTPTTGETVQQTLASHGFKVRPITNILSVRLSSVTWALVDMISNEPGRVIPRLAIDPVHCPVLRKAFQGGYRLEDSPRGDTVGPGRIIMLPLKNGFSHVSDAFQYTAVIAKEFYEGRRKLR
jgi:hypothetical protein